ncbi:MAG: AMP-binding protein [Firmicutes bacterium]|nr:AMP-binding protein [Bacillota bacterium]
MLEKYLSRVKFDSYEDFYQGYAVRIQENFNFAYDVVDEWARLEPEKTALVWCNERGEKATFNFGELKLYSDKAANFFRGLGIGKGDPVMLILKRRYEFWFSLLALHKLGAVAIPATHLLTTKDIVYRNNAAGIKAIVAVADAKIQDCIDAAQPDSPTLALKVIVGGEREGWHSFDAGIAEAPAEFARPTGAAATSNDDTLLLYFTSGTTGYPKMVRHDQTYPLGHILTAAYWQNVQNNGLHLTVSDTGWAKSAWGKIYGQWLAGAAVFVYDYDRFVPQDLLRVIVENGVTTFCAPPTIYRYLIKEDLTQYNLEKLEYCVVAGEPLNPEVYNQFLKMTGCKLMEGYGQTESVVMVATYPWMEPKPGSMGKPSPGFDMDIVDENGRSCEVGEVGEIVVRTDRRIPVGMFKGYYRDEELTRKVWHDGLYHTGDTAWRDEDGYYWFVGRTDDIIKSSGYRIGPFEVESALLEHPAVLECAVTGVPDELRGQVVKATVVLAAGYEPSDVLVKELQEHVKKVTAPYKYPRIIEFTTELPKTISGKIRRVEIRERDQSE